MALPNTKIVETNDARNKPDDVTKQIAGLEGHYILCGAGRTGSQIITRFFELQKEFVVIEQSPLVLAELPEYLGEAGRTLLYVEGDATEDETLEQAGIARARGLITALGDDKDNLFVTLTARSLNADVRIVARVNDDKLNKEKLERAGATRVVSTNVIGGQRMASEMIRPNVVDFLDQMVHVSEKKRTLRFAELPLTEIRTPALLELIEANRRARRDAYKLRIQDIGKYTGLLVLAIKSPDEEEDDFGYHDGLYRLKKRYRFTPRGDVELQTGDILVVVGTQDKLDEVKNP